MGCNVMARLAGRCIVDDRAVKLDSAALVAEVRRSVGPGMDLGMWWTMECNKGLIMFFSFLFVVIHDICSMEKETYAHQEMCWLSHRPLYDSSVAFGPYVVHSVAFELKEATLVSTNCVCRSLPFS